MNKYKTLVSNTALISIGTFGSKILVFLMVRFYTSYLTPSDYGTADLITQTANLIFPLISLGITDGVFRFALMHPKDRKSVFSAGIYVITCGALLFLIICPILTQVENLRDYIWLIIIFTMSSCYHSLCAQFVRAKGNTKLYAIQGLVNTALVIGLNILFLAVFDMGIIGYVLSVAIADVICTAYLIIREKLWENLTRKPKVGVVRQMLIYSIPMMPTTIFWWIITVSDRYMVNGFIGADANGIYTVAYKIPTLLSLLASVFLEAWQFSALSESQGDRNAHIQFYSKVWSSFQSLMFLAAAFVIAFSKVGIYLLSDPSYYEAWKYMPLLSLSMVFSSFATYAGSIYIVEKKSMLSFWTTMVGAILNIALNFILIPSPLGVQGAAIATVASYFVVFVVRIITSRKLLPFKLYGGRLTLNLILTLVQAVIYVLEPSQWIIYQSILLSIIVVINFVPLWSSMKKILKIIFRR